MQLYLRVLLHLRALVATRITNQRGASAVEYGLLVAGVALGCLASFEILGRGISVLFEITNSQISQPPTP